MEDRGRNLYFWYDRRHGRCEHTLDPATNVKDCGRREAVLDRKGDRYKGRAKLSHIQGHHW